MNDFCVHSIKLTAGKSGELLHLSRQDAGWEWMSFFVHRVTEGEVWENRSDSEKRALVLLAGRCTVDWGSGPRRIGQRANVFARSALCRLPPGGLRSPIHGGDRMRAGRLFGAFECKTEPRLVTPKDVTGKLLRGGGNASRQIVDVMRPDFPADKLIPRLGYNAWRELVELSTPQTTMFTPLPVKWIWMRFTTIACTSRLPTLTNVYTQRRQARCNAYAARR